MHNNSSEANYLQLFLTLLVLYADTHIQQAVLNSSWISLNYIIVKETRQNSDISEMIWKLLSTLTFLYLTRILLQ